VQTLVPGFSHPETEHWRFDDIDEEERERERREEREEGSPQRKAEHDHSAMDTRRRERASSRPAFF
jgi:hypothetical protein